MHRSPFFYISATGLFLLLLACFPSQISGQPFTKSDSLRGTLSKYRAAYDVSFYDLNLKVDPEKKFISGFNTIHYEVVQDLEMIQIDLFANMQIDSITTANQTLPFEREGDAVFITFPHIQPAGTHNQITIYYNGNPIEAERPPWDGGFVWQKDATGKDWIGVACEGIGASLWWPNKDHLSDEPDSMQITCAVPDGLMCVANGNLINTEMSGEGYRKFTWRVQYPINNYNVSLNIADYAHIRDVYHSADGKELALDYYVLKYNREKAEKHFKQVHEMLACFEQSYGQYPFWNDGYALVETPYWGMEHQGAIAYGNDYQNNEFGFDFIIVHESAHEYWGNSISVNDHAEMWIHEAFTTYAEALYLECKDDYPTAIRYLLTQKPKIQNEQAVLGPLGVNYNGWEDADMYYKGTWMLHSIRNTINNDSLWLATIKNMYQHFAYQQVNSDDIIAYMSKATGYALEPIFELFLSHTVAPKLEYRIRKGRKGKHTLEYRWNTPVEGFNMGMRYTSAGGESILIYPNNTWQQTAIPSQKELSFAEELFYFDTVELK